MQEHLKENDSKEIKQYNRIKILLSVISLFIGAAFLLSVLFSGFSTVLEKWIQSITGHPYLAFLLFVFILGGIEMVITLPLGFYSGYVVEHKFGLSNQSFGRWCWEEMKEMLVALVLFTPLLVIFYFFLRQFPLFWWVFVGFIYFFFSVLLVKLGPVLLFPLFYKFSPIENESLKNRLKSISEKIGLTVSGIFSFNLSKNTKKANAAFAGLGKTRRILLADTLLENFSIEEIEAVVAHELGHYRYGHLWKGIFLSLVFTFGGLFSSNILFRLTMKNFGGVRGDELSALPLLILFLMGFALVVTPFQNAVSRHFEREADLFSVELTKNPEHFISALERLEKLNKSDREPHPLVEFFFYSHPPIKKRIDSIRLAKKGNK